ncbi:hypothetical protein BR93DRAFT_940212 [Coniochaeta sp. PMI_546]|nr:hypothetical protein BR93DRAFT_940212 [Coniochaeta sp. PMI_546]
MYFTLTFSSQGTVGIQDLSVYPISTEPPNLPDLSGVSNLPLPNKVLFDQFLSAGKKVWDIIQQPTLVEYTGHDLQHRFYPPGSRLMIDCSLRCHDIPEAYSHILKYGETVHVLRHHMYERKTGNRYDPYPDHVEMCSTGNNKPVDLLLVLMPPVITACSLSNKGQRWCCIMTKNITLSKCDTSAVDHLILLSSTKINLRTLSGTHQFACTPPARLMVTPKPLLLHFHGDKGRGKTTAAHAVAEMLQAPLLIPDLSWMLTTDILTFTNSLDFYRTTGARWRSILLLDEADHWTRDPWDYKCHDADVHAYEMAHTRLKTLLYSFPGIVILVTRSPETVMDRCIGRRITLSINFNHQVASGDERLKLWWKILRDVLKKDGELELTHLIYDHDKLKEFVNNDLCMALNGHQIRNGLEAAGMNAHRAQSQGDDDPKPMFLEFGHIKEAFQHLYGQTQEPVRSS